ncbi:MAG: hypothetical protein ABF289_05305 [Clostridiales bacterium]
MDTTEIIDYSLTNRNSLKEQYSNNLKKYTNDSTLEKITEGFDSIISLIFNAIIFPIISTIISIGICIFFSISFNSIIFGILLFITLLPISLIGVASFSIAKALSDFAKATVYIVKYIIHLINEIKSKAEDEGLKELNRLELTELIFKLIIFPIIKKIIRLSILGDFIYTLLKTTVLKTDDECFDVDLENSTDTSFEISNRRKKVIRIISKTLKLTVQSINIILIIIGIISSITGILLTILLFFLY